MRKAVIFDEFALQCPFQYTFGKGFVNNGYNCSHPKQEIVEDVGYMGKKKCGCCHCFSCPLGIEAEQQDLTDPGDPDTVSDEIDWDGLCDDDDEIEESEYLLVPVGEGAGQDQIDALYAYERHMHRYDKAWLDKHGIPNSLCS